MQIKKMGRDVMIKGKYKGDIEDEQRLLDLEMSCGYFYANSFNHDDGLIKVDDDDDEADQYSPHDANKNIYWQSQHFLLQEILHQYNSTASIKLREQIKKHIDTARDANLCNCMNPNLSLRGCNKCLRRAIVNQLSSNGITAVHCTSKWKRTPKFPGGTHEYIQVIVRAQGRKKEMTFLIEVGFQEEFRMAKACDEYNKLISQLPDIYIGKSQHLNAIIRVVCEAAKKSSEEQKIHIGPWRKISFMQMKWSASSHQKTSAVDESTVQEHTATSFQLQVATTVKVA